MTCLLLGTLPSPDAQLPRLNPQHGGNAGTEVLGLDDRVHKDVDIREIDARSARWIASDALRELESAAVQARVAETAAS